MNFGSLIISSILLFLSPLLVWFIDTYLFPPYWILIVACILFAAFILMLFVQYKTSGDDSGGIAMGGFFASAGFLIAMIIASSIIAIYYLAKHFWM
jgi:ABC-type Mn2+/Zn2+ transport system permease subunit